jgi:hypothetical protein
MPGARKRPANKHHARRKSRKAKTMKAKGYSKPRGKK